MVVKHEIEGYDNFVSFMEKLDVKEKDVYVYFSGSKNNEGVSWCPDCVKAEPIVKETLEKLAKPDSIFIYVLVGDRDTWKNPQCKFRKDPKTKLMQVPTLMRWGGPQRLEGEQCEKKELVEMIFSDDE